MPSTTAPSQSDLFAHLAAFGQSHVVRFWDELDDAGRQRLAGQLATLDLAELQRLWQADDADTDFAHLVEQAEPPAAVRLSAGLPECDRAGARQCGRQLLAEGRVGMILVAGGQGTRLGFSHPKGLFPIGPVSQRTLFEMLFDQLRALGRRYGRTPPLYVMTSPATHEETVAAFARNRYYGLSPAAVTIFRQGVMPAVDAASGRLLLADKDSLALSPDGHGGLVAALAQSGALADIAARGVDHLFYCQVDNPLVRVCDDETLGFHVLAESEMTTQVVAKRDPAERVGVAAAIDGRLHIVEYSDLPPAAAERRLPDGSLALWAGNIAVHVIATPLLERAAAAADTLPWHRAVKKTPYLDESGQLVEPAAPNAVKFERFIFDLLPAAGRPLVVEVDKGSTFAPVKNADGAAADTPGQARAAIVAAHRAWVAAAGGVVEDGVAVEVSPLVALDPLELQRRLPPGVVIDGPTFLDEAWLAARR